MKYLNFIYLKNIMGLGAESGEIRYDLQKGVNVIFGSNGTGKSRLLKAIRTFFSDRIQVAWLRTDDKGNSEMEMYLDDKTKQSIEIDEAGKAKRNFTDSNGKRIDKMNILELVSFLAIDPTSFFAEKGWHERIKIVVSALDYKITKENWTKRTEILPTINFENVPARQLEDGKEFFEEKRRDAGRVVKEYEHTIENLERQMPTKIDIDFDAKISEIDVELQKSNDGQRAEENRKLQNMRDEVDLLKKEITSVELTCTNTIASNQAECDKKVAELEKQIAALKSETKNKNSTTISAKDEKVGELTNTIEKIIEEGKTKKAIIEKEYAEKRAELNSQKQTWLSEKEKYEESRATLKLINQSQETLAEYQKKHARYDNCLTIIAAWKKEILAANPINGLEVGTQDLFVDGRPWAVTNTARQVEIFIQVAMLHIAKLPDELKIPLLLCDDFEHIDAGIRAHLIPAIIENEFQAVFAQVDPRANENLKIFSEFPEIIVKE